MQGLAEAWAVVWERGRRDPVCVFVWSGWLRPDDQRLGTPKERFGLCHHAINGELWKVLGPGSNEAVCVGGHGGEGI